MSLRGAIVLKRSGLSLFALWTFFACGGRDNAEMYTDDGGLILVNCGNGQLDIGEQCDGNQFGEVNTCEAATGRPGGTLGCKECRLDISNCTGVSSGNGGQQSMGGTTGTAATTGRGGRNGFGGFGNFGGNGGTMGFGGGAGGTMGMGFGGRRGGRGGTPTFGGAPNGGAPTTGGAPAGGAPTGGTTASGGTPSDAGRYCARSSDCTGGQVCCGTITGGQYDFACAASCGTTNTTVGCSKPSDCTGGQVCCGTRSNAAYTSIQCAATCTGQNETIQCATDADCTNGGTCQTSLYLPPPFTVCR